MITFTEYFLNITMTHNSQNGHKGYNTVARATHTLPVYTISDTKQIYKIGGSSYSQTVTPYSVTMGKEPETIKIEGKLCRVSEVNTYLTPLAAHRKVNTIYNVFLPCSILQASSTTCPELMIGDALWLVDIFKVKRDLQHREWILYELALLKWYGGLPSSGV